MVSAAVVDHQTHQALSWAGGIMSLELRGRGGGGGEGLVLMSGTSRTEMVVMLVTAGTE